MMIMRWSILKTSARYACAIAFVLLAGPLAFAQNETPDNRAISVIRPFNGIMGGILWPDQSECMTNETSDQGYLSPYIFEDNDNSDNDPWCCSLVDFRSAVMSGCSLFVTTHGNSSSLLIEVYQTHEIANERRAFLMANYGFQGDEISVNSVDGMWCVAATSTGIAAWSANAACKQIIFLGACNSWGLFASFQGGLELGYDYDSSWAHDYINASLLFGHMSGRYGAGTMRASGAALAASELYTPNFVSSGSCMDTTVLAPKVSSTWTE